MKVVSPLLFYVRFGLYEAWLLTPPHLCDQLITDLCQLLDLFVL